MREFFEKKKSSFFPGKAVGPSSLDVEEKKYVFLRGKHMFFSFKLSCVLLLSEKRRTTLDFCMFVCCCSTEFYLLLEKETTG
jgi:hypothetical protein